MAADFIVETPRGRIIEARHANGSVTAELKWNPGMGDEYAGRFRKAQRFMDSECLRSITRTKAGAPDIRKAAGSGANA